MGKLQMIRCDRCGKIIPAKVYPPVICLIVLRYVYYPGSFTQLTPGTPDGEPLITLLCGLMLQMGGVGCIRSFIFLIKSYRRLKNNVVNCQR